nr:hypothetical protein [Tanacetum cinerariifolium]
MQTTIELTLEQSQQGASNDVLVSIEGVGELKRNVWINGENKEALPTLKAKTGSIHMLLIFTKYIVESVKKSIDERVQLKREYDNWVNERQMQTTEEKVDTSKLDASSVDTESSRTESKEQDTSSSLGKDAHDDGVDIRPIYDEEPMAKVRTTVEIDVFAIGQRHTEQPEFNNEGE